MASEKTVNYTAEQTAEMVELYQAGTAVEAIASKMGRTARSVIAKLSREGVYKSKAKAKGEGRVTKAELVKMLAERFGVSVSTFESLEKATHEALEALVSVTETNE